MLPIPGGSPDTGINPAIIEALGNAAPPIGQTQTASSPAFTWGAGGRRLTPEQLAAEREIAQSMMKSNYSPVQNVWQGLGRVVDNVTGALDTRRLDKQADAQAAYSDQIMQSLLGGKGGDAAAAAMVDPYASKEVQGFAGKVWDRANPKNDTVQDYNFWKAALPPDQFEQWIANRVNPPHFAMGPNGQMAMVGGWQPPVASAPSPGTVQDGYRFKGGEPADQNNWEPVR